MFSTSLYAIKAMNTTDDVVASVPGYLLVVVSFLTSFYSPSSSVCYVDRNFYLILIFMVMHFSFYSVLCKIAIPFVTSRNIYISVGRRFYHFVRILDEMSFGNSERRRERRR